MIVEWLVYVCVCVIMVIRAGAIILQNFNFLANVKILPNIRAPEKKRGIYKDWARLPERITARSESIVCT